MEEDKTGKRMEFAKYIKDMREQRGLSKFKASQAIGYRSDGVINQVEQGRAPLPMDKIHAVADLYGIELEELLDKLQECEPELYAKYVTLERAFFRRFTSSIMRAGSGLRPDFARHHRPFPGGGAGLHNDNYQTVDRTIYYPKLGKQAVMNETAAPHSWMPAWLADKVMAEHHVNENRW